MCSQNISGAIKHVSKLGKTIWYEIILPIYYTLGSGLKGTHSYENICGYATHRRFSRKYGMKIPLFKTNGDDQNSKILRSEVNKYLDLMSKYN